MGGSSGAWAREKNLEEVVKQTQRSEERQKYDLEVNSFLQDLLSEYNRRDANQIRKHLATISQALDKEIEGSVELVFGGSVSKHTFVNGLSDIDMLVRLNNTSLMTKTPQEVKEYFAQRLGERLPGTEVKIGRLAVTVRFSTTGIEVQLLPAISTDQGVRISKASGDGWSQVIRPDQFAQKLTLVNQSNNGRVVPVIKLFKGLNSTLPDDAQLKGYHIESLAIDAFKNYRGRTTYHEMLKHLCQHAATGVLTKITETTGQSRYVDEYLGENHSRERQFSSAALQRMSNRLARADVILSVDEWKDIIDL